jgi:protein O-GlcNAc transferase
VNGEALANALALRRAGKFAEAAAIYSDILREQPRQFDALHALGILRYQAGQLVEAERLIGEAVQVKPDAADALYNRGSLLSKLNRHEEAVACFDSALAVAPDYAEAHGNRGAALMALSRYSEALADFDRLVALRSGSPEAWYMRGLALRRLERLTDAHASITKALGIRPNFADALRSRAEVSLVLESFGDALADAEQARALDPKNADAWLLRADALVKLGRRETALESYDKVIALKPGNLDAIYNRATNLIALRRFDEAATGLAHVLHTAPDYPFARGSLVFSKLCGCDWKNLDAEMAAVAEDIRKDIPMVPFQAMVLCPSEAVTYAVARKFSAWKVPSASEALWKGEIYGHDKIRVAYLSGNFHHHAVARLMAGVFEHHDRSRFEVTAISFGPDDNSSMRARMMRAFDHFIDVQAEAGKRTARRLREMEIDIAVDLMGFTEDCRPTILPHRPVPVQVNYLGYPGTMGADYIDYIIADQTVVPPDHYAHYSEKVVHLPHSYLPGGGARAIADVVPSRAQAGLPENGFVFCCFHHVYKIMPAMFDVWMRLLAQVQDSVLWLAQTSAGAAANLRLEAEARGVAPSRLVFANVVASDADHLARLKLADLFLDALPYNAHATATDALWAGVPVLTVPGMTFPGRVAASLLKAVGMQDMIAPSLDVYEAQALTLARDDKALKSVRAKLARNRETGALFDTARFARDLENAYVTMWERSRRGLAPESFVVGSAP